MMLMSNESMRKFLIFIFLVLISPLTFAETLCPTAKQVAEDNYSGHRVVAQGSKENLKLDLVEVEILSKQQIKISCHFTPSGSSSVTVLSKTMPAAKVAVSPITDDVTQVNIKVVGQSPDVAMDHLYQTLATGSANLTEAQLHELMRYMDGY